MKATRIVAAAVVVPALIVAGCSNSTSPTGAGAPASSSDPTSVSSSATPASSPAAPSGNLYVSVGDSYAAGYQPTSRGHGHTTGNGFAYQVVKAAAAKGYHLRLVNFGCSGATTASALRQAGCSAELLGPGATPYRQTQAAAAEAYLRAHRGRVGLITVSLGGNDITRCAMAANTVGCLTASLAAVKRNLTTLLRRLRAAAGPATTIVGTSYPDVFLGRWLSRKPGDVALAKLSVLGFRGLINPALRQAYGAVDAKFADVTAATGAYQPLTKTTVQQPYGRIPVAVARVCRLTYFCEYGDIHPRSTGYAIIARLVVGELPRR